MFQLLVSKIQANEEETIFLDKKIVQMILNSLPKLYQTFVSIQRALTEPLNLEALTTAVEIEERTQDSSVQEGVSAAMVNRGGRSNRSADEEIVEAIQVQTVLVSLKLVNLLFLK